MSHGLRSSSVLPRLAFVVAALLASAAAHAQPQPAINGINWLNSHRNANGSWGATDDLTSRDTARVLLALNRVHAAGASLSDGFPLLVSQQDIAANQILAEEVLALRAAGIDASAPLARLALQRSDAGGDFGGFSGHTGDTYDSALAVQALATAEATYGASISAALTTLLSRQNTDGGWGIDRGFDSSPLLTAEVLLALSAPRKQLPPQAAILAAQGYLTRLIHADGSIGADVLQTAVAFRALVLSGYDALPIANATYNYLSVQQRGDGSWGGDAYVTARVLDAWAVNSANMTFSPGGFTLTPTTVAQGGTVRARLTIVNTGFITSNALHFALYDAKVRTRPLATRGFGGWNPGEVFSFNLDFVPPTQTGTLTIVAVADSDNEVDEFREDDNEATATLTITGKPDLQVFATEIVTTPSKPQPSQQTSIAATIHNNGDGDAGSRWAIYDKTGTSEILLGQGTTNALATHEAQVVTVSATLAAGAHTLRVVSDADNAVDEAIETNNEATKTLNLSNVSNVDLRIRAGNVTISVSQPPAGTPITTTARVENTGTDPVDSKVTFYDGVPGAGGVAFATVPVSIDSQSSVMVQASYTTTSNSRVVYAVADPDNLLPESDETNNAAFVALTDQSSDLSVDRDSIVLPKRTFVNGNSTPARVVVRNIGLLPASHVEVVLYDDLPQLGGNKIADAFVDVPAQGKAVVPATFIAHAGQRFVTAVVNPTHTVYEPDLTNNRAEKPYFVNGSGGDVSVQALDLAALVVDPSTLSVSGSLRASVSILPATPIAVTLFEDVDGDHAYNPEVDNTLGTTIVQGGSQWVQVAVSGTVRFAPADLLLFVDSTNAISETNESDNIVDLYEQCSHDLRQTFTPSEKWSRGDFTTVLTPVARLIDTNGDDVIDENDVPMMVVASPGNIGVRRGDNGNAVWSAPMDGRQSSPVIADVDGDGKPEIIVHSTEGRGEHHLVALNAIDGSRKWTSPSLDRDPHWTFQIAIGNSYLYGGAPIAADLDGDGHPEVISGRSVLNGADGTLKWVGSGGSGRAWRTEDNSLFEQFFTDQEAPIAVDLTGDGKLEVVAGNTAYRPDGSILWQRTDLTDGYTAPVYLNGETNPHICLVTEGNVYLLNPADGSTYWGPKALPGGALLGGAPTVWSGLIGVAGDHNYTAFDAYSGDVWWTTPISASTNVNNTVTNSATFFLYQNNGSALAYSGYDRFVILDPRNGAVMYEEPILTDPFYPTEPVVADLDNDGHAEVVIGTRGGLKVIGNNTWNGAPAIFNESAWHIANVSNESGSVPTRESVTGYAMDHYRSVAKLPTGSITVLDANLVASYPRIDSRAFPHSVDLTVRVGNRGWGPAPSSNVQFIQVNADGSETTLATATARPLAAGAYDDVTFTYNDPPSGGFTFYAKVDSANAIPECIETDNTSPRLTLRLSINISADTNPFISDPRPRPGDAVDLLASAHLSGAVPGGSLKAQFFLGNPASGGTSISPLLDAALVTRSAEVTATVSYHWTVSAPSGPQNIYVLFDPTNAVSEDDETDNAAVIPIDVSSAEPVKKLSGGIVFAPPAAEPGSPVTITALVQNIGNVALTDVVLNYSVSGGPVTSGGTGSVTIPSIAKNAAASLVVGTFIAGANGTYTVTVSAADPAVTLMVSPKSVHIGPFAVATLTATPSRVPISIPVVQAHVRIEHASEIVAADDPLFDLIRAHAQRGVDFESTTVMNQIKNVPCFKCHIHPAAAAGIEAGSRIPGVHAAPTVEKAVLGRLLQEMDARGLVAQSSTASGRVAWSLGYWHEPAAVETSMLLALEEVLRDQNKDGSWSCHGICAQSFGFTEGITLGDTITLSRAFEATRDPRYSQAMALTARWELAQEYASATSLTVRYVVADGLALATAAPYLDPTLQQAARARAQAIVQTVLALQNPDGSFGSDDGERSVTTAQTLMLLAETGATLSDPIVRSGTIWLLNSQQSNGSWAGASNFGGTNGWLDSTAWPLIALPRLYETARALDVDYKATLLTTTELVSSSVLPTSIRTVEGGTELRWHFTSLPADGTDLYYNVRLKGLAAEESRPTAAAASVSYVDPYSSQSLVHPLDIPSVTGFAPVTVGLTTDRSAYAANSDVTITESIANGFDGLTNDLAIRDAAGTTVATLAQGEALTGLPRVAFPGWHYSASTMVQVPAGSSGHVAVPIDFSQLLAQLGASGTFDRASIRVTLDAAPTDELPFSWLSGPANVASGTLVVALDGRAPAGTSAPLHIWFDSMGNGLKPTSLFDRALLGNGPGLTQTINLFDQNTSDVNRPDNAGLVLFQPPISVGTTQQTQLTLPVGVPTDLFQVIWEGAFYAPVAGTYQFLLGSGDSSWLDIDGVRVANNGNGRHELIEVTGSANLTAGFHQLRIRMFQWNAGFELYLKWAPPGEGLDLIPSALLFPEAPPQSSAAVLPALVQGGPLVKTYHWNSGSTANGSYTAAASVRQDGAFAGGASASFAITAASQVSGSVATDRTTYDVNDVVHSTGTMQLSGNGTLTNLAATLSIVDPSGATVASTPASVASLQPAQAVTVASDWSVGVASPGSYSARLVVRDSSGVVLSDRSVPFQVRSTALSGAGLSGTLTVSSPIPQGNTATFTASLTNHGNAAVTDAPFAIVIGNDVVPFTASIAVGGSTTKQVPYPTTSLAAGSYSATLASRITGSPVPLATANFEITTAAATTVTASIASDKPAYDSGETVHGTATIQYVTGSAPLTNVKVTQSVVDGSGATVASGTSTIATLSVGQTATTNFDWPIPAATPPGTYTLKVVVANDAGALAQQSTTFTVRATTKVTGTIVTPTSVTQGDPFPITVTLTNGGNVALVDAPFTVTIGGDVLSFTASIDVGATTTKQLTYSTAALSPNTYIATLAYQQNTLATTSFSVTPIATSITATATTDKPSYDGGETLHGTAIVHYATGPAPLTNVTVTQSILDASNATLASGTSTIATLAVGATANATFDWPIPATTAPGTYTLRVVASNSSGTLAQSLATFTVRATSKVTGTIAAPASVIQGDSLPITVTLTNGGNVALSNAPLTVTIGSDVIRFNADVPVGATTTKQLTYSTASLSPNTYTATLVYQQTTLATASFTVTSIATNVTATAATDKSAYDAGETVHGTATVRYTTGSAPLTNVSVTQSIVDATNATIAGGTSTIATLAVGQTATTTFDWPIATAAPGTYTLRVLVTNAGGTLAQQSTTFAVRSTTKVTGTIATPASVNQGDPLPIDVSVTNRGNVPITNGSFAVTIGSAPIPFTATIAVGATFTKQLTYATTSLAAQTYTATLVSQLTSPAATLASSTFQVKTLPATVTMSNTAPGRVLIWSNCSPGNSGKTCTPTNPPFLTSTLTNAGINWTITGDENSFLGLLRTGAYMASIVEPPPTAEAKISDEWLATIHAGPGLLLIKDHPDAMPKLAPALGVSFQGKLKDSSTLLNVLTTPFTTASNLTVNGDGVKITLDSAAAVAKIASTQAPAISMMTYGKGRTVILPFDAESTTSAPMASFLLAATGYVSTTPAGDARRIVPVDFTITTPAGGASTFTIALTIPAPVTIVYASPNLTVTSPPSWSKTLMGGTTTHFTVWLRLPETLGTYTVTGAVGYQNQLPFVTKTVTLQTASDRAAMETAMSSDLTTLRNTAPAKDLSAITAAQNELTAIRAANPTDTAGAAAVIPRVMNLISDLQSISIDVTVARTDADRLLLYWQSRASN